MGLELKVHQGGKDWRCPGCRRRDIKPGSTHKPYRGAPRWCDGMADPLRERAMGLLARVHDKASTLAMEGRYEELLAFLSPLEKT